MLTPLNYTTATLLVVSAMCCTVVCTDAPPPLSNNTWPPECKNAGQGFGCKGTCAPGFKGQPTAVCGKKGGWTANGACKPAKCDDDDLPRIANATWGHCDDMPIGEGRPADLCQVFVTVDCMQCDHSTAEADNLPDSLSHSHSFPCTGPPPGPSRALTAPSHPPPHPEHRLQLYCQVL
jgi:hypothetical protein